ncbi:glycosyl hydrolase 53 family protein [Hymenobacter sp. ASUV-10]|uniref:Arabinogalactan endo-beta-1,4-galactanase n=1 Tax=Hymenobacter aranciens TaxID=3063996 RepID=A0ABT9BCE0_9BACT|nr:glycosyl hydrolase 53 family protein [Hymenobacter sp. ASUV-10]MDO7875945.1 glycosyl hydrolase 53 family protein [Hymenobacter sp. ASUV-10]
MKNILRALPLLMVLAACKKDDTPATPVTPVAEPGYYRGADLSFSPELVAANVGFTDNGQRSTPLATLKRHGGNLVRLRLWHTPTDGHSGLAEVAAFARQAKQAGLSVLLDIHYADSWTDPSQQPTPRAWQNLSYSALQDSVYGYTRRVLRVMKAQQAQPALVQIGNEVNGGMLWPQGRVSSAADYAKLAPLLQKGLAAVADENAGLTQPMRTIIHFAGAEYAVNFFEALAQRGVQPDVLGLSYYPQFHGKDLDQWQQWLTTLVQQTNRDVLLCETAYPFSLGYADYTHNSLGLSSQLIPDYSATPAGQQAYLSEVNRRLKALPGGHGLGFCYWAPDWVAWRGPTATNGSGWENQALYDFNLKALPAWSAFAE